MRRRFCIRNFEGVYGMKKKILLSLIGFLLIFSLVFLLLQKILIPKWDDALAATTDIEGFYVPDENTYEFLKEMEVPEIVFADLDGNVKMMSLEEVEPYHPRRRD